MNNVAITTAISVLLFIAVLCAVAALFTFKKLNDKKNIKVDLKGKADFLHSAYITANKVSGGGEYA